MGVSVQPEDVSRQYSLSGTVRNGIGGREQFQGDSRLAGSKAVLGEAQVGFRDIGRIDAGRKRFLVGGEGGLEFAQLESRASSKVDSLSGGMKRRVLIAKALAHEPDLLFLDEPTAGVDVELRKGMWDNVRSLRDSGVTVILTTHYIREAEDMADRIETDR